MCNTKQFKDSNEIAEYITLKAAAKMLFKQEVLDSLKEYVYIFSDLTEMTDEESSMLSLEILSVKATLADELNDRAMKIYRKGSK